MRAEGKSRYCDGSEGEAAEAERALRLFALPTVRNSMDWHLAARALTPPSLLLSFPIGGRHFSKESRSVSAVARWERRTGLSPAKRALPVKQSGTARKPSARNEAAMGLCGEELETHLRALAVL